MNKFYKRTLFLLIWTISVFVAKAQTLEDVVNNIRSNNVAGVIKCFDNFVTITLNNNQSVYSKTQAEQVVKDFFAKNPVKDFTVAQSGTSSATSKFAIGTLSTANGPFRLYVLMKQKDDVYILQEIRFEK